MYNVYKPCPYCVNTSMYNPCNMYDVYDPYPCPSYFNRSMFSYTNETEYSSRLGSLQPVNPYEHDLIQLKDYGPEPLVVNINEVTKQNNTYRTTLWTGDHLQLTLMSIKVGEDIGLEIHHDLDQFIRIEDGQGIVKMGNSKNNLDFQRTVYDDFAFIIPAGKWHNIINTGDVPLKLYSIYAPPQHPHGTVHETKANAQAAEENHHRNYQKGHRAPR